MSVSVLRPLAWVATGLAGVAAVIPLGGDRPPVAAASPVAPPPRTVAAAEVDNPRVEPGAVRWHATFADAQAAAQKSGRPVLLFHLMGRLDRQFC